MGISAGAQFVNVNIPICAGIILPLLLHPLKNFYVFLHWQLFGWKVQSTQALISHSYA